MKTITIFLLIAAFSVLALSKVSKHRDGKWYSKKNIRAYNHWWVDARIGGDCRAHCLGNKDNTVCQMKTTAGKVIEENCCQHHGCVALSVLGKNHPEVSLEAWEKDGIKFEDIDPSSTLCPKYEPVSLRHTGDDRAALEKRFGAGWFNHRNVPCDQPEE